MSLRGSIAPESTLAIGIDIGGTAVKLGAVDAAGAILARRRLALRAFGDFDALVDALAVGIAAIDQECGRPARAIGISCPGFADPVDGHLRDGAANVSILRGRSLPAALNARGLPARVTVNDGVAAALGERRYGAARDLDRFALITLGTGVGGCVVIDGAPILGPGGEPPEIGAMVLDANGPAGSNGMAGTLEAYAAASGFVRAYAEAGGAADASFETLFAAADRGEPAACRAIDATCRRIAQAFGTMVDLLGLQGCLIGGGISQAVPMLAERVRAHMPAFTWPMLLARTEVRLAATGNDAGLLGAALLARDTA